MKNITISKRGLYVLLTAVLVLIMGGFISKTVLSHDEQLIVDENGLRMMEQEYVKEIRSYLSKQGFENSGVNLTCITEENGNRTYQVELNHKRISKLNEEEKENLFSKVRGKAFDVSGCYFKVKSLG